MSMVLFCNIGMELNQRTPNPDRLLDSYFHSAATLNYVRALLNSEFADLNHPEGWNLNSEYWTLQHVENLKVRERYQKVFFAYQRWSRSYKMQWSL